MANAGVPPKLPPVPPLGGDGCRRNKCDRRMRLRDRRALVRPVGLGGSGKAEGPGPSAGAPGGKFGDVRKHERLGDVLGSQDGTGRTVNPTFNPRNYPS